MALELYSSLGKYNAKFALRDSKGHTLQTIKGKTTNTTNLAGCQIVTENGETEEVRLTPYTAHANMEKDGIPAARFEFIGSK